jgi:hypothetical protein
MNQPSTPPGNILSQLRAISENKRLIFEEILSDVTGRDESNATAFDKAVDFVMQDYGDQTLEDIMESEGILKELAFGYLKGYADASGCDTISDEETTGV